MVSGVMGNCWHWGRCVCTDTEGPLRNSKWKKEVTVFTLFFLVKLLFLISHIISFMFGKSPQYQYMYIFDKYVTT